MRGTARHMRELICVQCRAHRLSSLHAVPSGIARAAVAVCWSATRDPPMNTSTLPAPFARHQMELSHCGTAASWQVHSFPIDCYTTRGKLQVVDGCVQAPDDPDGGTGVKFDRDRLAPFAVEL